MSIRDDIGQELERMVEILGSAKIERALDISLGASQTAVKLGPIAQEVTAISSNGVALEEARHLAEEKKVNNISFLHMDVHKMNFPDNHFDIVCSRFAPHHFEDIGQALCEMIRVLKPGGKLYILDCSVIDSQLAEDVINKIETLRDSSHRYCYPPARWEELIEQLPLEHKNVQLHQTTYQLPEWFDSIETPSEKREEVFMWLDSMPPTLKRYYPFSSNFITAYYIEVVAEK